MDYLSELNDGVEFDIPANYLCVLVELDVPLCYFSAPEVQSSEVDLVVLSLDRAQQVVLLFGE